jgi:chaperonin GroEL (HSP60 family)
MAKNTDWLSIESEYIAGEKSVNAIAIEHGVSEGAIRAKAKKNGWIRSAAKTKRELVSNAMAGITKGVANVNIRNLIDAEAEQDVQDMQDCLTVARACVKRLYGMVSVCEEPKDIKIIVDANKSAMETIRRIRGLDDETKEPPKEAMTIKIVRARKPE